MAEGLNVPLLLEDADTSVINPGGTFPLQIQLGSVNGLTAHSGGGQANALPLTAAINRVTTVAAAGDSVALPPASPGLELIVVNAAAVNSMNVFTAAAPGTDVINALSDSTAFAIAAGKTAQFTCTNPGQWHSILSA